MQTFTFFEKQGVFKIAQNLMFFYNNEQNSMVLKDNKQLKFVSFI